MRLILFSDLHAHTYREFAKAPVDPLNLNSRLENCLLALDKIRTYAVTNSIKTVVFAGDLFDKRNVIQTAMYNLVWNRIELFKREALELILIVGNHDQTTLDGTVHSLEPMKPIAKVIEEPTEIALSRRIWLTCVPYMEDTKALHKAVNRLHGPPGDINILVAHMGLQGAKTGPVEYQPKEQLSVDDIGGFDFSFFGHYHKRQKMGKQKWYIGSPMQQNRGEREDLEKGFLVFDTDTLKIKNVPLGFPEFVSLEYGGQTLADVLVSNKYVDLLVDGATADKAQADVESLGAAGVNAIRKPKPSEARNVRVKLDPGMEIASMVQKYCLEYCPDGLDQDRVMKLVTRFLGQGDT